VLLFTACGGEGENGGAGGAGALAGRDSANEVGGRSGAGGVANAGGASRCPIAEGTKYRVSVLSETARSPRCHISRPLEEFELIAARPVSSGDSCLTPALAPPPQVGVQIVTCRPSSATWLGVNCEMQYPSTCRGLISFYF
jgi:hypothetical protein